MSKRTSPLDNVRVAAPCSAGWENMVGTERVRFCGQCQLNVYNLSAMSKRDAERLLAETEGRLCVRYYRRADGTILTKNCPVGLRALKRRLGRVAGASLSAALSFFAGLFAAVGLREHTIVPATSRGAMINAVDKLPGPNPVLMGGVAPRPMMGVVITKGRDYTEQGQWVDGQRDILERPARLGRRD